MAAIKAFTQELPINDASADCLGVCVDYQRFERDIKPVLKTEGYLV